MLETILWQIHSMNEKQKEGKVRRNTDLLNNIRELEVEYKGCSIEIIVLFFVLP